MQALKRELKKIGSLALFFLIGFGYILLVMKLFLKEYSLDAYILSKAIIGALVAAKAVVIMDATPLLNRFKQSPRYISVLYRTFVYTFAVLIIGFIEHILHAYHKTKAIAPAIASLLESENFYRFLAVTLCIAIVFLIHNIFNEIDNYLGKGSLRKFFADAPLLTRQTNQKVSSNKN
jgi:hypothetical protein